ncbi:diol dehydratase reactivase subunit alpha [Kineosporia sp. J2-2]|uniref:Diol dehydratase reactivase subunit alpha n=1 Tax=Kineosporia corallincola TaxID=2835133 RepID=A0ABS5TTF6_9ACTN|nr:diol dehydratase reactivase subunit alpha [Kineosporia corallincola]MBT0774075.1 diol dehydratase reactivase subunit alpha [Kineosporia corallincola]
MSPGIVAGVDIGNSTTEACAFEDPVFLGSGLVPTTGIKGTTRNVDGVEAAIRAALRSSGRPLEDLTRVFVNEATPVISGLAMETITETLITESTMIGHDPRTPGGAGLGVGVTVPFAELDECSPGDAVIAVVPAGIDFAVVGKALNAALERGVDLRGAVLGADDAVLVSNRLNRPVPIVDEVRRVEAVPAGMTAAVEVAAPGRTIRTLCDAYGLATVFSLDAEQTRAVAPVARALTGIRSAVVVRTPSGEVSDRRIPAGTLELHGDSATLRIDVSEGAEAIMALAGRLAPLRDATGEAGTNVGGMLATVRQNMADVAELGPDQVRIGDLLAVDTFVPREVRGGLAGEVALENAVALAAMVRTSHGPMRQVADVIAGRLRQQGAHDVEVVIGGVEAEMATRGALTTPGTERPLVVLDLGGGSTDAALAGPDGRISTVHVAGAGDLVTRLIAAELGVRRDLAEEIKQCPLARSESFFHLRLENGTVRFFDQPLAPELFARVLTLGEHAMTPVPTRHGLDRIRQVRRTAKQRVFVVNALRALRQVAPYQDLRQIGFVVLLGGSALDFEIPELVADALAPFGIVCGTGNVRGTEGPRNAVASGLVLARC